MQKKLPIFYSALLLTGVNLLLRLAGTSFQVYLSSRIGAAGIGLLQLTMSVGSLAMVAGMGGIRTATMYLTAEELGKGWDGHIPHILSSCFLYSIIFSGATALLLWFTAPWLAANWIDNEQTLPSLRLFAAFLPAVCLSGVMTGYFTAESRIGTLALVEVAEQLCSMAITLGALTFWAGHDPQKACLSVVLGGSLSACLTLGCLMILRLRETSSNSGKFPIRSRLLQAALPLAVADDLRTGINTAENLMVPKRLALHPATSDPLAAFGMISGMVFPVILFPAALLFGLNELLIPELARCAAAGHQKRIHYLVRKTLRTGLLYGLCCGGLLFLLSDCLCLKLYHDISIARFMRRYGLLIPMLYCDCVVDAMTKGLGQQKICVRYNILTSCLDVLFLYLLLPRYGMTGYFVSFLATHLLNFFLSLRRLLKITHLTIPFHIPILALAAMIFGVFLSTFLTHPGQRVLAFLSIWISLLFLCRVLGKEDLSWLRGLVQKNDPT